MLLLFLPWHRSAEAQCKGDYLYYDASMMVRINSVRGDAYRARALFLANTKR